MNNVKNSPENNPNNSPQQPLRSGRLRRVLFVLVGLITLIVLVYAEEDLRGKWAWTRFKHEWEKKGETFELTKIAPAPVSDDENFAMAPVVMSTWSGTIDEHGRKIPSDNSVINRLNLPISVEGAGLISAPETGNWQKGVRTDFNAWQKYYRDLADQTNAFPLASQSHGPAADVLFALGQYDSTLEELRQAAQRPYSRFPLEYNADNPAAVLLPHLSRMRSCARLLQLRADAELALGQMDQALADIKLMFRLGDSIKNEPLLISQLVRIAILAIAIEPVWEGLADHKWSDAQVVQIGQALQGMNFLADYRLAMRGEMAFSAGGMDYLRRTRDLSILSQGGPESSPGGFQSAVFHLIPDGWFYQNELRCGRFLMQWYLPLADEEHGTISPAAVRAAEEALDLEINHAGLYNVFERLLIPALGNAVKKFAFAQTTVDLAGVACALERYHLAHGQFPESLNEITPQFIKTVPHDVIDGQPLHYHRDASGKYVLYSVGWNEIDDGGQVGLKPNGALDIQSGDWVWR